MEKGWSVGLLLVAGLGATFAILLWRGQRPHRAQVVHANDIRAQPPATKENGREGGEHVEPAAKGRASSRWRSVVHAHRAAAWLHNKPQEKRTTFHPKSPFMNNWTLVMLAVLCYHAVFVPFLLVFESGTSASSFLPLDIIMDTFLLADIWIAFHTAYLDGGSYVTNGKCIAGRYMRGWFAVDCIAALPLEPLYMLLCPGRRHFLHFLRLLRLLKLPRALPYLTTIERDRRFNPALLRFCMLNFAVFLIAHWIGCLWFSLGFLEGFGATPFTPSAELQHASLSTQFITSFYWAFTAMTGAGALSPSTDLEFFFSGFVVFIGLSSYATIIGNVGSLLSKFDSPNVIYHKKMEDLHTFMNYHRLPVKLQERIEDYYEYLWFRKKGLDEDVLNDLPDSLRTEVKMVLNQEVLKKVPFLSSVRKEEITMLVTMLKPRVSIPGEYLIWQGAIGDEMYFLSSGHVEVLINSRSVATLSPGSFFGEYALLFKEKRTASVRSLTYCDLFVLYKKDFDRVLSSFPEFDAEIRNTAIARRPPAPTSPHAIIGPPPPLLPATSPTQSDESNERLLSSKTVLRPHQTTEAAQQESGASPAQKTQPPTQREGIPPEDPHACAPTTSGTTCGASTAPPKRSGDHTPSRNC